jgi:hypothetical protein
MNKNYIPFFEVDGKKYEIRRNRYLNAEFDKMKNEMEMTDEEQVQLVKERDLQDRLDKLADRRDELYAKYLETFDEDDEELYNKACKAYDALIDQFKGIESVSGKQRQMTIDMGEKLIIKSLQADSEGKQIRTEEEAEEIWGRFVDENGKITAIQFVTFTMNYIVGNDEESDNPFIAQAQAKAEQKANMKKGIAKVK